MDLWYNHHKNLGTLPGPYEDASLWENLAGEKALRKAAGNAVELVTFSLVGWSPVWLLAAAADVMGGSQVYLRALVADLQQEGVLASEARIVSVEELLAALEQTLGQAADTVDMPPLNVEDMRASWTALRRQAADLPDADGLAGEIVAFDDGDPHRFTPEAYCAWASPEPHRPPRRPIGPLSRMPHGRLSRSVFLAPPTSSWAGFGTPRSRTAGRF